MKKTRRDTLMQLWRAAIDSVSGETCVARAIQQDQLPAPDAIIAVGKAATGMCKGALNSFKENIPALVVTKYEHADQDLCGRANVTVIESAHPIPDEQSLLAGETLIARVKAMPADSHLLLLVSGGASALAEALPAGTTLQDLQDTSAQLLAKGAAINEINRQRKASSAIKDGKLVEHFQGASLKVYAISDVEGDDIATIGSGLGDCHRARTEACVRIVASNKIARNNVAELAGILDLPVRHNEETLYGDVFERADMIAATLDDAEPGLYIWGGEPTIILPESPGRGGRNQSLALALSEHLCDRSDITVLVAGTDGTDGPTTAAGGIIDGDTFSDTGAARTALKTADAGRYLEAHSDLFVTGPTNTNVMDLVIALVTD